MKKLVATALSTVLILFAVGVGGAAQAAAENVRTIVVGDAPTGVAITHDGLNALVANSGSDSVSVISLVSETVISTITVGIGDGPMDLVISADGTKAFVTNYVSADVSVIDLASLTVVDTIVLGGSPFSMALSPDGTKAVVPDSQSGIYVIDLTNDNVVYRPIAAGGAPVFAAISSDGLTAYVTAVNTGSVYVVNLATGVVTNTFALSLGMIYGITLSAQGDSAYVAVYGGGAGKKVVELDLSTGAVLAKLTAAGAPGIMTMAPDGQSLLVATQYSGLKVLNLSDSSLNETVAMGQDLRHIAISPAGNLAVVTSNQDDTATLVDFNPALTSSRAQLPNTGPSTAQNASPFLAALLFLTGVAMFSVRRSLRKSKAGER
jgi:LPXTG-motif cell wall-anchored protein